MSIIVNNSADNRLIEALLVDGNGYVLLYGGFNAERIKFIPRKINGQNIGMFQYQENLITNFCEMNNNVESLMLNRVPTFFNGFQLENTFADCHNLPGPPYIGWESTYNNYSGFLNINGVETVRNLEYAGSTRNMFHNCYNLTGPANVFVEAPTTVTVSMYENCYNLWGDALVPIAADNISRMYFNCPNLNGNLVLNAPVRDGSYAFYKCSNLHGNVVYSQGMQNMRGMYLGCNNLGGYVPNLTENIDVVSAFSGTKVEIVDNMVINGPVNLAQTFSNCENIKGTIFLNSDGSGVNAHNCFYGRDNSERLNIVVNKAGNWDNWIYNTATLCGTTPLTWEVYSLYYVNHEYNLYIYNNGYTPYSKVVELITFNLDTETEYLNVVRRDS